MFDYTFNTQITVRRAISRSITNKVTYEEPSKDDDPVPIPCRIDPKRRRVRTRDGEEDNSDAQMVFRKSDIPDLKIDDMVVQNGLSYKIITLEYQQVLFGSDEFGRADLVLDRTPVSRDRSAI